MTTTSPVSSGTTTPDISALSSDSAASAKAQKDQFLQILLTQLQHQNPTDPMKPGEFASQLAQFSALEQQVDTNTKLDTLIANLSSTNVSPTSYLGNMVDYSSATAPVQNGKVHWSYSTTAATKVNSVDIVVKDASGNVVYTGTGDIGAGTHDLDLTISAKDGSVDGSALTMSITAKDATGAAATPIITSRATITAVDTTSGATNLEASGYVIPASSVTRIATPVTSTSSTVSDAASAVSDAISNVL